MLVVNGTLYDGCLEKACLQLDVPTVSQTDRQPAFQTALSLTKNHLLEMWKAREGPMRDRTPKYKAELDEDSVPTGPEPPSLKLCSLVDDCLVLPRDVRSEFLTDAVRAPEWRKVVQEFDRTFATGATPNPVQPVAAAANAGSVSTSAAATSAFDWGALFPDEPREPANFHSKYEQSITAKCAWCPEVQAFIVDTAGENTEEQNRKPMLFLEAKENYEISQSEAFLTYGAGTWLMDSKATQWLNDQDGFPHKACLCEFKSDEALVLLEECSFKFKLYVVSGVCLMTFKHFLDSWRRINAMAQCRTCRK